MINGNGGRGGRRRKKPGEERGDKIAELRALMERPEGASVRELAKAVQWERSTVRSLVTRLRRTYRIETFERRGGESAYRWTGGKPQP